MELVSKVSRSPENIDRTLIAACAVVWLLVLGFSVAAGVALVDLGRGRPPGGADSADTPWLLYGVIAVSALVIAAAVPLLLRARNTASGVSRSADVARAPRLERHQPGYPAQLQAAQAAQAAKSGPSGVLDRVLLRGGLGVLTVMGLALIAVAIATHLMALDHDGVAWALYVLAAVLAGAMAVVPEYLLRQIRTAEH